VSEANKVLLPEEVAEAIEELRKEGCTSFNIMRQAHGAMFDGPRMTLKCWAFSGTGKGSSNELMSALVNGYEIEKAPEEMVREYYERVVQYRDLATGWLNSPFIMYERELKAVKHTLDLLGIKIDGVNA
jgi:hypothetical protein